MKHIKIHSFTHLLHLLYCLILALPLCAILARCLYVQFNKNAFESYSGGTEQITDVQINYKYQSNEVNSVDDLIEGNIYHFNLDRTIDGLFSLTNENQVLLINLLYVYDFEFPDYSFSIDEFYFMDDSGYPYIEVTINKDYIMFTSYYDGQSYCSLISDFDPFEYDFHLNCVAVLSDYNFNEFYYNCISYTDYNEIESVNVVREEVSTLDNAFEYSLNEFTQNSNIGRLNLVNWFTDVFLDSSNATNMLYLNFINWYMNYALLVSCVYILFLVLMWFVSLARRLIYKGMEI